MHWWYLINNINYSIYIDLYNIQPDRKKCLTIEYLLTYAEQNILRKPINTTLSLKAFDLYTILTSAGVDIDAKLLYIDNKNSQKSWKIELYDNITLLLNECEMIINNHNHNGISDAKALAQRIMHIDTLQNIKSRLLIISKKDNFFNSTVLDLSNGIQLQDRK